MNDMKFTVVFKGDVAKLNFNPLLAETIFGEVAAVSRGDALADIEPTE